MTFPTGTKRPGVYVRGQASPPPRRSGFTLLEIIMVIGLVAVMAGIVASMGLRAIMENQGAKPAYEIFREATHEARLQAINDAHVMYLTFDQDAQRFLLSSINTAAEEDEDESVLPIVNRYGYFEDAEESDQEVEPSGPSEFPVFEDELEVEFRGLKAENGGFGISQSEYTAEPLKALVYHPSGTSTPAVAILRYSNGEELVLTLDSFSNGPQLSADEGVGY